MRPKQGTEHCQKHKQARRKRQGYVLLARGGMGPPSCGNKCVRRTRVCGRFRSSSLASKFIATRQIIFHSSYLVYQRVPLPQPTSLTSSSQETVTDTEIPSTRGSGSASEESSTWRDPLHRSEQNQRNLTTKNYSDELQGVPDWLQEFKHGFFCEGVPEHRDTSSFSHELLMEPRAKVVSSKHNIFIHFPKGQNCDVYLRTNKRGILAEDAPLQSCPERNILVTS